MSEIPNDPFEELEDPVPTPLVTPESQKDALAQVAMSAGKKELPVGEPPKYTGEEESLEDFVKARFNGAVDQIWRGPLREEAINIARDYQVILARRMAGEDVDREVAHLNAQIQGLATASALTGAALFQRAIWDFVGKVVRTALP